MIETYINHLDECFQVYVRNGIIRFCHDTADIWVPSQKDDDEIKERDKAALKVARQLGYSKIKFNTAQQEKDDYDRNKVIAQAQSEATNALKLLQMGLLPGPKMKV